MPDLSRFDLMAVKCESIGSIADWHFPFEDISWFYEQRHPLTIETDLH